MPTTQVSQYYLQKGTRKLSYKLDRQKLSLAAIRGRNTNSVKRRMGRRVKRCIKPRMRKNNRRLTTSYLYSKNHYNKDEIMAIRRQRKIVRYISIVLVMFLLEYFFPR